MRSIINNPHDKEITKRSRVACLYEYQSKSATVDGGAFALFNNSLC
ncbi:hypothetical protein [Lacibacter cauensis]|nr:hypothetical protein [Lacibacter cauensis]